MLTLAMFFQFIAFIYLLENGQIQRMTESLSTTQIRTSKCQVIFRNYESKLILWLRQGIHLQTSR